MSLPQDVECEQDPPCAQVWKAFGVVLCDVHSDRCSGSICLLTEPPSFRDVQFDPRPCAFITFSTASMQNCFTHEGGRMDGVAVAMNQLDCDGHQTHSLRVVLAEL